MAAILFRPPCVNQNLVEIYFCICILDHDIIHLEIHQSAWNRHNILITEHILTTLIARFMGTTWGLLGPTGPRWAPCWHHESCFLGIIHNRYSTLKTLCSGEMPKEIELLRNAELSWQLPVTKISSSWYFRLNGRRHENGLFILREKNTMYIYNIGIVH